MKIEKIVIHHTASMVDHDVYDIDNWHKSRKFKWKYKDESGHIGYHYAVDFNAKVHTAFNEAYLLDKIKCVKSIMRPIQVQGAHCEGHNHNSLGVALMGSFYFTANQTWAIGNLVYNLLKQYKLEIDDVYGHYELKETVCPAFDMDGFREKYVKPWRGF